MKLTETKLDGVVILEPDVFGDHRGFFMESWSKRKMEELGLHYDFVQDNHSSSTVKGTLRGIHFQRGDKAQAKLVRCTSGAVLDVAVDLRQDSPTFGNHVMVELSDKNNRQLYIPRGFAHGFQVLSETAIFTYKVDNFYAPDTECSIRYNDSSLAIQWPVTDEQKIILSEKDLSRSVSFENAEKF